MQVPRSPFSFMPRSHLSELQVNISAAAKEELRDIITKVLALFVLYLHSSYRKDTRSINQHIFDKAYTEVCHSPLSFSEL